MPEVKAPNKKEVVEMILKGRGSLTIYGKKLIKGDLLVIEKDKWDKLPERIKSCFVKKKEKKEK